MSAGFDVEFLVNNAGFGTTGAFATADARTRARDAGGEHHDAGAPDAAPPAGHARAQERAHPEPGLDGGVPAGALHGGLLRVEGVRELVHARRWRTSCEGTGVTATVSCPGATATEFSKVAGNDKSRLFQAAAMAAPEVAADAYRAMMRGRPLSIAGVRNKLSIQSLRFAPRSLAVAMAASLNQDGSAPALPAR